MSVLYKLKGVAETRIEEVCCPRCEVSEDDIDDFFDIENIFPTFEGIIATVKCFSCGFYYIPEQEIEIVDDRKLKIGVSKDMKQHPESNTSWDRRQVQEKLNILNGAI